MAERAGLSRRGISDLERGARRAPHPATMRRLAEALGLDSDQRDAFFSRVAATAPETGRPPERQPHTAASTDPHIAELLNTEIANVAEMVRRHRLDARLTQQALADKAGLSVGAISDLEGGIRRFPDVDTLELELVLDAGNPASGKMPAGALTIRNDAGKCEYAGPCPPPGDHPHRYFFTVFAVGTEQLQVNADTTPAVVGLQLHFNSPAKAEIVGLSKH